LFDQGGRPHELSGQPDSPKTHFSSIDSPQHRARHPSFFGKAESPVYAERLLIRQWLIDVFAQGSGAFEALTVG
jgi:hypothetical protein